jgi:hypothetical protein
MTLDDRQLESLLRQLPLVKPSTSLDARVMARPTLKIWSYVGVGSALAAAAAALIIVVLVHWTAGDGGVTAVAEAHELQPINVVPVVNVIEDKIVNVGDDQPPLHQITQEKFEKTTWVDKTNGIHIETTGAPHREIILIQADVK